MFASCTSEVGGVTLGVPHGEFLVDAANCRRCLCNDGSLEECEPSQTCMSIQLDPVGCEYNGNRFEDGDTFQVCGC